MTSQAYISFRLPFFMHWLGPNGRPFSHQVTATHRDVWQALLDYLTCLCGTRHGGVVDGGIRAVDIL